MSQPEKLLNFSFVGLCLIGSFAFCNITVFYNLYNHLQTIGIPDELCGLVIGAYSLTAMLLFLVVSPFLNPANGPRMMLVGMAILIGSGFSYLWVDSFRGLLLLRVVNGLGQFLLSASVMTMLVSVIPMRKSGQAFGLYSVAILLPYGIVPALMELLSKHISSPSHGYALATILFVPAALIAIRIGHRHQGKSDSVSEKSLQRWSQIKKNLVQLPVGMLLLLNFFYFIIWSSIFFLFKGFAIQQGITNVGSFFTVQMGLMIVLRVFAGRFFDRMNKSLLMTATFTTIAFGYLMLDHLPGPWAVPLIALLFGTGMGAGYPAINGLMFEVSASKFRPLNANLMQFAVQGGFFFGPALGGFIVARHGFHGYFLSSSVLSLVAAALSIFLAYHEGHSKSRRFDPAKPL